MDLAAQRRVAAAMRETITAGRLRRAGVIAESLPWDRPRRWRDHLRTVPDRSAVAALVLADEPTDLTRRLFGGPPRLQLSGSGFWRYELPGELSGSALLTEPSAIAPYAAEVRRRCRADGLAYLELRGSPSKYRPHDPVGWLMDFKTALGPDRGCLIRFVVIGDRRRPRSVEVAARTAVAARRQLGSWIAGLDIAGAELRRPGHMAQLLSPVFRDCLPVTIHAGEGRPAAWIWEAAYRLHADRIGHGLSLADSPDLAHRFRDRRICLELCPTSNREVVGYYDPAVPESAGLPAYPLRSLLDLGVPLTLCTDNPGISRTTLADEYLAAGRMSKLTWWEALALIKQGFLHAFCPATERDRLLVEADRRISTIIAEDFPWPQP